MQSRSRGVWTCELPLCSAPACLSWMPSSGDISVSPGPPLVGQRVEVQPMFVEGPAEAPGHLAAEHPSPLCPGEDSSCFTDLSSLVHS